MMYRKPSRRWVALKAAYLLPLSALAVVAFARPQALSEIEEKVESTAPTVTDVIKTVAQQLPSLQGEGLGVGSVTSLAAKKENTDPTPFPSPAWEGNGSAELPDSNLVKADLRESGAAVFGSSPAKNATELLDSTMQAVGARKIADGTYIGHFQPNLNNDTVRIARATILNRESKQTDEHLFQQNTADPYAFNITLNAETRKDRTGYYIRYLQPVSSTVRHYDRKEIDPMMLSTDSVLTKRSASRFFTYTPVAIEHTKKETRIFMYLGFKGEPQIDEWRQQNINHYSDMAIVDERTGDKYVCRATDYDYFKHVKDETITYRVSEGDGRTDSRVDTFGIYQVCLVFPPLDKNVKEAHLGSVERDGGYSQTFNLNEIPRKGRVITN